MKNNLCFSMALVAVIVSGCASAPQNPSLAEAQNRYDNARTNPMVTSLAAPELAIAGYVARLPTIALAADEHIDFTFFWLDRKVWQGENFRVDVIRRG